MSRTVPFFDLFSDYIPERNLRLLMVEVLIEEASINQKELSMDLRLISREKLPEAAVEIVRQQLCSLYRLNTVEISVRVEKPEPKKPPQGSKEEASIPPRR